MPQGARRKRAAIYIRVSRVGERDRQSPSYQTEDVQEERCRAMAVARGADVVGVYRDIDKTGRKWNREGFDQVMDLAREGRVDLVIVYYISRVGRNLIGTLGAAEELRSYGVDLISVNEGFDLSTSSGKLLFRVLASFAEYESDQRGEAWSIAKARAMARGVWVGRIPFGYAKDPETGVLLPHPEHAPVVVEMFERRAEGAPIRELARMIDAVKPLESGQPRSNARTSEIIKRTKYRGTEPTIPRLVSDALWFAAQRPDAAPKKRSSNHDFFLTGIARCGTCGGSMAGNAFSGQDRNTPIYTCSNRSNRGAGACEKGATIIAARLEPWVLSHVQALDRVVEVRPDQYGRVAELSASVDALERELAAFASDVKARSILGESGWQEALLARVESLEEAREELAAAQNALSSRHGTMTWADVQGDPERLRAFLRGRILSLVVHPGRGKTVDERCELDLLR